MKGISVPRDLNIDKFDDIAKVNDGDRCVNCGNPLVIKRGIEVGNIFQLETKYSGSMGMTYTDQNGQLQVPVMGCYGIGIGRLLACILEDSHDEYGPIWPYAVAPWQVHICMLNPSDERVREAGEKLYKELSQKYEVIMDDRGVTAGVQFADADLLGVPYRVIIGKKNIANGEVELTSRDKSFKELVKIEGVMQRLDDLTKAVK